MGPRRAGLVTGALHIIRPQLVREYERRLNASRLQALEDFGAEPLEALEHHREQLGVPWDRFGTLTPGGRAYVRGTQLALDELIEAARMEEASSG